MYFAIAAHVDEFWSGKRIIRLEEEEKITTQLTEDNYTY